MCTVYRFWLPSNFPRFVSNFRVKMSATDYLRLGEHKIFKELKASLPKNLTKAENLIVVHDSVLFTWDLQNNCILCLNIKAARSREGDNVVHQKLLPLHPPLFTPEFLIVNEIGTLLVVAGASGVLVLQLPERCPPYGAFDNNKEVVYCRSHSLDERLLSYSDTIEVRQVRFHPGSVDHNHVLVLTSDNMLRLYQVQNQEAVSVSVFPVGEKPSSLFPGSKTPFLDIYGEIAVDFDFGHPEISETPLYPQEEKSIAILSPAQDQVPDKYYINVETQTVDKIVPKNLPEKEKLRKEWENLRWPIYILRGDMTIYYMYINLKNRSKVPVKGPIPLSSFDAEENEACSLICLNTTPQIICVALSNGTICHCIVLNIDQELHNQLKLSAHSLNEVPSKEIVVFENVELEMGLKTFEDDIDIKSHKYPIFLHRDELKLGRYFATHTTGVHMVTINCVDELQAYANSGSDDVDPPTDIFLDPSNAEYLVCTKAASLEKVNPVIGFSIYYEPASVIVLVGDGSLLTLGLLYAPNVPPMEEFIDDSNSPLKKMLKEPFDQYIQKILKKASTQPVLKLSAGGERVQEQCYELLQRSAQVFRDEYFKQHTKAREELQKRIQTLTLMKKNQQKELERINKEKEELQEKASNLAEKYEDAKDKQDEIIKRCQRILMLESRKRSEPTEAEKVFMKECQQASEKIAHYWELIDKIKKKMKYQQIQMENWKSQEGKKVSTINETHVNTIKTNLTDTTKKIAEMITDVKDIMKHLNLK